MLHVSPQCGGCCGESLRDRNVIDSNGTKRSLELALFISECLKSGVSLLNPQEARGPISRAIPPALKKKNTRFQYVLLVQSDLHTQVHFDLFLKLLETLSTINSS